MCVVAKHASTIYSYLGNMFKLTDAIIFYDEIYIAILCALHGVW